MRWATLVVFVVSVTAVAAETRVALTGADLTLEQLIAVARHGAKVQLSPEARQDANRAFGRAPTAAWQALRKVVPLNPAARPNRPIGDVTAAWLKSTPAALFYPAAGEECGSEPPKPADPCWK